MSNASPGAGWQPGEHDPQHPRADYGEQRLPPYPPQHPHTGAPYGAGPGGPGFQDRPGHHPAPPGYGPAGHQPPPGYPPPEHAPGHHGPYQAGVPQAPPQGHSDTKPGGRAFVLVNLLTCGALAPLVFGYLALRHWSRAAGACALFSVPFLVLIVGSGEDSALGKVTAGVYFVFVLLTTAYLYHDIYSLRTDRHRDARDEPAGTGPAAPRPASAAGARTVDSNAALRAEASDRARRREESRKLLRDDPTLARELGVGRPDLRTGYDDGGLVDLNRAPAQAIAGLPGVTSEDAQALVRARSAAPFVSLPDALIRSDLPAHLEDEISDYVVF